MVSNLKTCCSFNESTSCITITAQFNLKYILTCHIHPSREMNMTTPINCVKRMSGVKKDHTGHSATLKLHDAAMKAAVVMGGIAGYFWS